ncbi:hypothetical protein WJX75_008887 [Coccomyxa subellipsoidea]|uniref:Uncharacterized protein n=1 Tax=Coccomyxa subellipsoidea TaxID=248742 RepID=A0ABR2Z0X8_9CHLO
MERRDKVLSLEEKCFRLEEELQMSNHTILSLLEQGGPLLKHSTLSGPTPQTLALPASQQLPLQPNPLWEPQGQASQQAAQLQDIRPGKGAAQGERLREARRKAAAEQGQGRAPAEHRPAWNAGPAARPPPRGRKPTQILPHPAPPLQARREGADSLSPILAEQRESRAHGSVTTGSALGGAVARLAAQRAGIRRPAAISVSLPAQVPNPAERLQQAGQQAQLMSQPGEVAGQPGESMAYREAHAQVRLKNKVIAELQTHKRQLAEELEAAVGENAALREAVLRGGRAKEQVDQLLEALRKERDAHASAAQQAQRAQEDNARAQQRVKALMAKQAMDREHIRKLDARVAEKARMLEQLYSTMKELKAQYEASQKDTAEAAAHSAAAVQRMRAQLTEHQQALEAAQDSMRAAAAAATRAEERCEELARDLRTEQEARQAAEAALEALQTDDSPNQGSPPTSTTSQAIKEAKRAWNASDGGDDGDSLQAELSIAHRRADELQLRLDDSVAEARRYRQRAKWLTAEVAAFRGRIAGHVDEEVLEEVAATPDAGVASLGNVGGARARLLDAQESLRRQLQAQEMKAAESARAYALAVEVAELKQQLAVLQASDKLPSDLSQCTPRSISHDDSHQEAHVSSVKEAFEAMSASGGWSVYDNRAARRISAGGSSASA